jgi:hypothetical protein
MQLAFSSEETNDKLKHHIILSLSTLLQCSTIVKMNFDLLESEEMQTDLGRFLRNMHYLIAALLS